MDGIKELGTQAKNCVAGFQNDVNKWCANGADTYAFVLLAVNVPPEFKRRVRARNKYLPGEFVERVEAEVRGLGCVRTLGKHGDACVVIKQVADERTTRCICCMTTPQFGGSRPHEMEGIDCIPI